jgi:hypothetical protein
LQFDEFWAKAISLLRDKLKRSGADRGEHIFISNWRPDKGFLDEKFPIRDVTEERIECLSIHAGKPIEIPRDDMETLFNMWDDFLTGQISKLEVVENVPRTAYAISLMKYFKENTN